MRLIVRAPRTAGVSAPANQSTPWSLRDFARLLRFQVPGVIALVVCYVGARQTSNWDHQLYWIVGAMAAMLFTGTGWTAWLLVGSRALRRRQRRLAELTSRLAVPHRVPLSEGVAVAGPKMTRFHRPDCPLARGREVSVATPGEYLTRGLTPCGVCMG